jgi:uncharacterized membrane-anchored protein YhcB (DUF1043 family)
VVYLILQILWFLVAAALIGFAVGWLCRSAAILRRRERRAMAAREAQGELEGQREQLEARLAEAASANKALQEEVAQLRQAAEADAKARRKLEREHSSTLLRLEARERDVARLARAGQGEDARLPAAEHTSGNPGNAPLSGPFVRQK